MTSSYRSTPKVEFLTENVEEIPVLINACVLECLWQPCNQFISAEDYKHKVPGEAPHRRWFDFDDDKKVFYGYHLPFVYFTATDGIEHLSFSRGRHRTRWLLEKGHGRIPVAISPKALSIYGHFIHSVIPFHKLYTHVDTNIIIHPYLRAPEPVQCCL